jgi:hypothetical protein
MQSKMLQPTGGEHLKVQVANVDTSVKKHCRLAGDVSNTRNAAVNIIDLYFKNAAWNNQTVVLSTVNMATIA